MMHSPSFLILAAPPGHTGEPSEIRVGDPRLLRSMEKFHHPHAQIEKHRSAVDIAGHFPRRTLEDGLHVDHIAVVDERGELGGESCSAARSRTAPCAP